MRTRFATLIALPTLMVITGQSFVTQVLPSVSLTKGSVLSNPQQDSDLYMAKNNKKKKGVLSRFLS